MLEGWLRTGDLAKMDEDGYIFILGRLKDLINRGGNKVTPDEVDDVLTMHPAVAEAATFGVSHATLGEDVVSAVVIHDNQEVSPDELREFAFGRLADYKIPSQVICVESIPKSRNGKAVRSKLPQIFAKKLNIASDSPADGFEIRLASIWEDILNVENVRVADNFFMLGGDSIRAGMLINRVREVFSVELSPATIFANLQFRNLATIICGHDDFEEGGEIFNES
jgi:long-subunit acyl-CoA synthetase (AMP-forming)